MGARELLWTGLRQQDEEQVETAVRMIVREEIEKFHGKEAAEELRELEAMDQENAEADRNE